MAVIFVWFFSFHSRENAFGVQTWKNSKHVSLRRQEDNKKRCSPCGLYSSAGIWVAAVRDWGVGFQSCDCCQKSGSTQEYWWKKRSFSTMQSFTLINTFKKTTPPDLQPYINTSTHINIYTQEADLRPTVFATPLFAVYLKCNIFSLMSAVKIHAGIMFEIWHSNSTGRWLC